MNSPWTLSRSRRMRGCVTDLFIGGLSEGRYRLLDLRSGGPDSRMCRGLFSKFHGILRRLRRLGPSKISGLLFRWYHRLIWWYWRRYAARYRWLFRGQHTRCLNRRTRANMKTKLSCSLRRRYNFYRASGINRSRYNHTFLYSLRNEYTREPI